MTEQDKRRQGNAGNAQRADPGQAQRTENRSESLLPGDDADDGRYDVAEEVNLDQQSDQLRRVGKPPKGIASSALPDVLKDSALKDDGTKDGGGR
ncbi:MAG: hypothetical protein JF619_12415 [Massilia sp.]|nr:hypothetical protein [Massilia sp.]